MRPTRPCGKCARELPDAPCDHLGAMYDAQLASGVTEQELIEYALDRKWALKRDQAKKDAGLPSTRVQKSRNDAVARAVANLCGEAGPRGFKCIRSSGHEGAHRY